MKETLYKFNPWWEGEYTSNSITREKYLHTLISSLDKKNIVFLIGLRRVGKTTLIRQLIEHLLKKIESKNILYISCEHPVFENKTLIEIVDEYRSIFHKGRHEKIYVFFDEVQLKEQFNRDLKILFDHDKEIKIFCSGSSATILKDKKAYLTGRQKTIEVEPLDFNEYLLFKSINVKESEEYQYKELFIDYLKDGGMPEYILNKDAEYLLDLADTIIYKDIVSFYGLKNPKLVRELFVLLCERVGKPLSYNKLAKILGLSVDTVSQYVSYFESSFLIYIVHKHSKSLNERIRAGKKVYIADIGIRNLLVGFRDLGAIFENLVFLKIKHLNPSFYYENMREIDFIIKEKDLAIESKFKEKIEEGELETLNKSKFKNKLVVNDYKFFLDDKNKLLS